MTTPHTRTRCVTRPIHPNRRPPRHPRDASCKKPPKDASQNSGQSPQLTEKGQLTSIQMTTPHTRINASPRPPAPPRPANPPTRSKSSHNDGAESNLD